MQTTRMVWLLVILATFFWGANFNAAHALAGTLPPLTAAAARFGVAILILLGMRAFSAAESALRLIDSVRLIALGLIGVFGFNYAFFTALHTTSPLNAALIMALSPLVTALLSTLILGTRLTAPQLVGIAIAFGGVTLVITGGHFAALHVAVGDWWMLLGCFMWSLYCVLVPKFVAHVPPMQQARWTIGAGALALIACAVASEPIGDLVVQAPSTLAILAYMAVCGTVLAYVYWLRGVQTLGPQRCSVAFNLVPVFTLLVNLALGVWPNAVQVVGLLTVITGVAIASGVGRAANTPPA